MPENVFDTPPNSIVTVVSFKYEDEDMRMDVTPIMNKWLDNTYPNNGFIKLLIMYKDLIIP